ncbi:hydroxyacylglutathione hydrolase [Arsukibacterium indicum]|uniref:Hydroxyacylglutathione hydrolase n=1 Tax=Arsukibacterium indicum TaxID=2848612 RepID=A0ABS6MI94_9GAMM|nr:hydroxyacylglutathione hydrolase [Arsukibacterium indicum]MBV2128051.1 hydroxyacylglutathione hydrolase [Arsukibacterium indicum]
MLTISPLAAFEDNYIWTLCQPDNSFCVVVDPGDPEPVLDFLEQQQKSLYAILITHHHPDHTGGIAELKQAWPDVRIIGPAAETAKIPLLTELVQQGDVVQLPVFNYQFQVFDLPGHTLGHIGFYSKPYLFCGDTLFSGGCGRLFEGTAAQLHHSLQKLAALPADTLVYCTHEYTLANLRFATTVEPDNQALQDYQRHCQRLRQQKKPTLPTDLATELQINPFLRCENKTLQQHYQHQTAVTLFSELRALKDQFKS